MEEYSKNRKWRVSLISTSGYNNAYKEIRKKVQNKLTELGFDVFAYEDTWHNTGLNVYSNCYKNGEIPDIAVLIINSRYGTVDPSIDDGNLSVTEAEYIRACGFNPITKEKIHGDGPRIVLKFIEEDVFDKYYTWNKSDYAEKEKLIKELQDKNWDNPERLCKFIDSIYNCRYETDNNLNVFSGVNALLDKVEKAVSMIQDQVFLKFVMPSQKEDILNVRGKTGSFSLRELIDTETYVEPKSKVYKKEDLVQTSCRINKHMTDIVGKNNSILVFGESGAGKSTSLMKAFLDHCNNYEKNLINSKNKPLFLSLSGINTKDRIDFIDESIKRALSKINLQPYPIVKFWKDSSFVMYFDALDECGYSKKIEDVEAFLRELAKIPHVLTTRKSLFNHILRTTTNSESLCSYGEILEIIGWDSDGLNQYIDICFKDIPPDKTKKIKEQFYKKNTENELLVSEPLIVSLCVQKIRYEYENGNQFDNIIKTDVNGKVMTGIIFDDAVSIHLRSETTQINLSEEEKMDLVNQKKLLLSDIAWKISRDSNQLKGLSFEKFLADEQTKYTNIDVKKTIELYFPLDFYHSPYPVHQLYLNYFGAVYLLTSLKNNTYGLEDAQFLLPSEGNRFFGDLISNMNIFIDTKSNADEEKIKIIHHLKKLYWNNFLGKGKKQRARVVCLYTMPRFCDFHGKKGKKIKREIFRFCILTYLISLLLFRKPEQCMLLNWMSQAGIMPVKELFKHKLLNERFASVNRTCYMLYYRQPGFDNDLNYLDISQRKGDWQMVLFGILEHFSTNDLRHRLIRDLDIEIIRSFINAGYFSYSNSKDIFWEGNDYSLLEFLELLLQQRDGQYYFWKLTSEGNCSEEYAKAVSKFAMIKNNCCEVQKEKILSAISLLLNDITNNTK